MQRFLDKVDDFFEGDRRAIRVLLAIPVGLALLIGGEHAVNEVFFDEPVCEVGCEEWSEPEIQATADAIANEILRDIER